MTSRYSRLLLAMLLAVMLPSLAACDWVVDALQDGFADFLESTTASLLEQAFPVPMPSGGGGG